MASLTNQQIDQTYDGLLKLVDNDALSGVYKTVTDGLGNETYMQLKNNGAILSDPAYTNGMAVDDTGVLFIGDVNFQTSSVDFTNATVTGLPTDNTTYDLGAVGAAGNINIALSGSDATNDVVTVQAGTNITLTDNGSNTFTIDATGGGGGGGITAIKVPYVEVTGPSSSDQLAFSVLIPANTFATGDVIQLTGVVDYTNPGGWVYNSLWISQNSGGVEGNQIGAFQTPNSADQDAVPIYKAMAVRTIDGFTVCPDQDNLFMTNSGPFVNPMNIDWSVDQYFKWSYYIDNAASSVRIQGLALTKLNS